MDYYLIWLTFINSIAFMRRLAQPTDINFQIILPFCFLLYRFIVILFISYLRILCEFAWAIILIAKFVRQIKSQTIKC